jgi:hypothetical protein
MRPANAAFRPAPAHEWTRERLDRLSTPDIQQLRENAQALGAAEVVGLCDAALAARPEPRGKARAGAPKAARGLVSRSKALQARGVYATDPDSGWCGVRKSDGTVVMTLWAPAIVSSEGGCSQLLWAPNEGGARPWAESAAGRQRLRHCEIALEAGAAEGIVVHGENFDGEVAEHNARSVYGADAGQLVRFRVERRGAEYWAVWGGKAPERSL